MSYQNQYRLHEAHHCNEIYKQMNMYVFKQCQLASNQEKVTLTHKVQSSICHFLPYLSGEITYILVTDGSVWDKPHWQGIWLLLSPFVGQH